VRALYFNYFAPFMSDARGKKSVEILSAGTIVCNPALSVRLFIYYATLEIKTDTRKSEQSEIYSAD